MQGQTKLLNPKSDGNGSSHPLHRRVVVPCLCDSATLSVSWWIPLGRGATGLKCWAPERALRMKHDMHAVPLKTSATRSPLKK